MLFQGSENSKKLRFLAHCAKIAKHKNMELNLSFSTFFQYFKTRSYIIVSLKMWVPQVVMQLRVRRTPKNAKIVKKTITSIFSMITNFRCVLFMRAIVSRLRRGVFHLARKLQKLLFFFLQNAIISGQPKRQSKYTGTNSSH